MYEDYIKHSFSKGISWNDKLNKSGSQSNRIINNNNNINKNINNDNNNANNNISKNIDNNSNNNSNNDNNNNNNISKNIDNNNNTNSSSDGKGNNNSNNDNKKNENKNNNHDNLNSNNEQNVIKSIESSNSVSTDGVSVLVDNSITLTLAAMNLKKDQNRPNSPESNLKPYSTPILTTRKTKNFDGNECTGFNQNRALSVDDFRIIDNESKPFTPSFSRSGDEVGDINTKNEIPSDYNLNSENLVKNDNNSDITNNNYDNEITSDKHINNNNHSNNNINDIITEKQEENKFNSIISKSVYNPRTIQKKNNFSSLLSANRKSIFNFQNILTSASSDDFSLLVRGEKTSDIFIKTSKLARQSRERQNRNNKIMSKSGNDNENNNVKTNTDSINNNNKNNNNINVNNINNDNNMIDSNKSKQSPRLPSLSSPETPSKNNNLNEITDTEIILKSDKTEIDKNTDLKNSKFSNDNLQETECHHNNNNNFNNIDIDNVDDENVPSNILSSSKNVPPIDSHQNDFFVGDLGDLPKSKFSSGSLSTFPSSTVEDDDMKLLRLNSEDRKEMENIEKMKIYYDIRDTGSESDMSENENENEIFSENESCCGDKNNDNDNNDDDNNNEDSNNKYKIKNIIDNENNKNKTNEKKFLEMKDNENVKKNVNEKDEIEKNINFDRSSSPSSYEDNTFLSTETVFKIADNLSAKNTTIQACRKLFLENRIIKEEYEKLCRTEIHFLKEKARSEAVAATIRLNHIFGESWCDKKNRILGGNGYTISNHNSPKLKTKNNNIKNENNNSFYNNTNNNNNNNNNDIYINNNNNTSKHNLFDNIDGYDSDNEENNIWPARNLISFIVKSNDDLRQEVCCLQLMRLCEEIFFDYNLKSQLYLRPYRIVSTGSSTGLVQVLTDTLSLDALKKTPGFSNLPQYFKKTFGTSSERLLAAKRNFASSLAGYSLFCHVLQIKDRHNGNLLIDQEGHIIHIDFGFLLSIAPGEISITISFYFIL